MCLIFSFYGAVNVMFMSLSLSRSLSLSVLFFLIVCAVVVTLITQHVVAVVVVFIAGMQIYPLVHVPIFGGRMRRNNFFLHFPLAAALD